MYKTQDLYNQTDSGFQILEDFFREEYNLTIKKDPRQKFAVRTTDTNASCRVVAPKDKTTYWRFVDYGDPLLSSAISPIDVYARHHNLDFKAALEALALRYGISDENGHIRTGAELTFSAAPEGAQKGLYNYEWQEITEEDCKIMGATVSIENMHALNWHSVRVIRTIVDSRNQDGCKSALSLLEKRSTPTYPIFMRQCIFEVSEGKRDHFFKIYEPLNPDKSRRFLTLGNKPQNYVNGLYEIRELQRTIEEEERATAKQKGAEGPTIDNDRSDTYSRLEEIAICSGERDALCCLSRGVQPVWLNSETAALTKDQMHTFREIARKVYIIPDIDPTGIEVGCRRVLEHDGLYVVWLPEELKQIKDRRGNPSKDLRDWMEQPENRNPKDFRKMLENAMSTRFWSWHKTKRGDEKYDINLLHLTHFLMLNGYYAYTDLDNRENRFIHMEGNVVEEVDDLHIRRFVLNWARKRREPKGLLNCIMRSSCLARAALVNMEEAKPDFVSYTEDTQLFFFEGGAWRVTGHGIEECNRRDFSFSQYIWKDNIFPHHVRLYGEQERFFTVRRVQVGRGAPEFYLRINYALVPQSPLMGYLLNTSRLHWRKELEYNFLGRPEDEQQAYYQAHRFSINGEGLSEDELREQELNFLNKIFALGYMLHAYKSPSRAWGVYAMDNHKTSPNQSNGRSGKTALFSILKKYLPVDILPAKKKEDVQDSHLFERIRKSCRLVLLDDLSKDLNIEDFYPYITSGIVINVKNIRSYAVEYENAPKMAFTTNYEPKEFNASSEGRLLYMTFGDFYHQQSADNDYRESRSIHSDFGMNLADALYPEEYWEGDVNFLMQCLQFYLSLAKENIKLQPPMSRIIQRSREREMGETFKEWADTYFAPDSGNLNRQLVRREVYDSCKAYLGMKATPQSITRKLSIYCAQAAHIVQINPEEYLNAQGRNISNGVEYLYIKADVQPDGDTIVEATTQPIDDGS